MSAKDFHTERLSKAGTACVSLEEAHRLAALNNLRRLEPFPSGAFDSVTRLAARTLGVPIVLLSLIDEDQQWFLSRVGWVVTPTASTISFCAHAAQECKPLIVSDATVDARFANDPLVIGEPGIRAYLGVPFYARGRHAIGTLCAIDRCSRDFGIDQVESLEEFSRLIEKIFDTQETVRDIQLELKLTSEREELFRNTFEKAPVGIAHTSMTGHLLRLNTSVCEMLGYSQQELLGISFIDITHPDDIGPNIELFRQMTAGQLDRYRMEKRFLCKDGHYLWTMLSVALVPSVSGRPDYIIAVIKDISERKRLESDLMTLRDALQQEIAHRTQRLEENNAALRQEIKRAIESEGSLRTAQSRLQMITANVPALIGYWNQQLRCEFASASYRDWNPQAPHDMIGMTMSDLVGERLFRLNEPYARAALFGHSQHFERKLVKPDGTEVHVEARYVPDVNESGEVCGFIVLVTDITALRQAQLDLEAANAQLKLDSVTDYLTSLSNRRVFSERSEDALQGYKANGEPYGLILLDLDDFKSINDEFGHAVGDEVLRAVGRVLRQSLHGQRDIAARLGGEEFAVLCFGILTQASLHQITERIRAAVQSEQLHATEGVVRITSSFGIALSHPEDADWKSIYGRADEALYRAKVGGKNRIEFGSANVKDATGRHRSLPARRR